ncbi:homocysteine S-methyltransferase family protein [Rhodobacteraceae bacterium D3-12]|nr:homocysteine S-methyltransferase family protein [Rhodobacteraceae bacterium D3-12]
MTAITLLDGSIGQEIVKRSGDRATPLWSTAVMMDMPGVVRDVHLDYFKAGATIATANTYAVLRDRLARIGLENAFDHLNAQALVEAEAARALHGSGHIAASLGPIGASYRPDLHTPLEQAAAIFAERVALLHDRVDIFLIETVASIEHAHGALLGCAAATKPVWLSLTVCDDDGTRLRSGEKLADLAALVSEYAPAALLLNCAPPEVMADGLAQLAAFGLPFGAYANGFTRISDGFLAEFPTVDALEQRTDLSPAAYADFAMSWVAQGATIIGGCCEVGPAHITELAKRLHAAGHTIT